MQLKVFLAVLTMGWLAFGITAQAATEKRVALVIGNSAYKHTTTLNNPANDARDMAAALKRLDFEVIKGFDLNQAQMRDKIRAFSTAIEGASVALFYYAGHGLQVGGNNYLAPVNATLAKESDLDFETVSLNLVLRQMERERRTNLVFLDACRDNPLARQLARSLTRSTNISSGLARVESGIGMLIGYATSPGDVALDGEGRNSPYTKALLKHIETPAQDISSMMIAVRQDVLAASSGKQVPWENSSLTGQFYFNPEPQKTADVEAEPAPAELRPQPAAAPTPAPDAGAAQSAVAAAYQAAVAIGTCGAFRIFEEQHHGTFYARLAEERLHANCQGKKRAALEDTEPTADLSVPPETAETKAAAADPKQSPSAEAPAENEPALQGEELVRALQKHLDRLGCEPGPIDGDWGARSRSALEKFNRFASLDLETDTPTPTALAALEGRSDRVCPQPKPKPVAKKTPATQKATAPSATRRRTTKVPSPTARRSRASTVKREADRFWGGEDTRILCQDGREFSSKCFPRR